MKPMFFIVTKSPCHATFGAEFSQYQALMRTFWAIAAEQILPESRMKASIRKLLVNVNSSSREIDLSEPLDQQFRATSHGSWLASTPYPLDDVGPRTPHKRSNPSAEAFFTGVAFRLGRVKRYREIVHDRGC